MTGVQTCALPICLRDDRVEGFRDKPFLVPCGRDEDVLHATAKGFRFVKALQGCRSYNCRLLPTGLWVKSLQRCSLITEDKERYKVTRVATMKSASDLKGYRPMTFYLWL